jgi:transposase-like protein
MSLSILQDARLYALLHRLDLDLAQAARACGCAHCGAVLHSARYPRKPRGGPGQLDPSQDFRFSFCCAREGCRRRRTPPSVRFLGRRVYFGAVVVLVSALRDGLSARRVAELRERLGVDIRTLRRWRRWWRESFVETPFWKAARGRFAPPLEERRLPASLLERCGQRERRQRILQVLAFLAPLSTSLPAHASQGSLPIRRRCTVTALRHEA